MNFNTPMMIRSHTKPESRKKIYVTVQSTHSMITVSEISHVCADLMLKKLYTDSQMN